MASLPDFYSDQYSLYYCKNITQKYSYVSLGSFSENGDNINNKFLFSTLSSHEISGAREVYEEHGKEEHLIWVDYRADITTFKEDC